MLWSFMHIQSTFPISWTCIYVKKFLKLKVCQRPLFHSFFSFSCPSKVKICFSQNYFIRLNEYDLSSVWWLNLVTQIWVKITFWYKLVARKLEIADSNLKRLSHCGMVKKKAVPFIIVLRQPCFCYVFCSPGHLTFWYTRFYHPNVMQSWLYSETFWFLLQNKLFSSFTSFFFFTSQEKLE